MNKARIRKKIGEGLWTECASMTTKHANMMVTPNQTVPSHQQFYGTKAYYARSLREWGEIGIVTDEAKNKINPKLDNKGHPCMLVNYAENHQSNVYRMWDLKTHRIVISRDILWLNKSYGDFIQDKKTDVDNAINDDELYEQEEPQNTTTGRVEDHNRDQDNNAYDESILQDYHADEHEEHQDMQEMLQEVQETTQEVEPTSTSTRRTRSSRTSNNSPDESLNEKQLKEMRQLGGWFNPTA
jgi:hypothetical protein